MRQSEKLKLWLPEGTDPLEVSKLSKNFEKLDGAVADVASPFKVGDILSTLRTDLGDDWLLCNGEPLDTSEYPELAGMLPGLEAMAESKTVDTISGLSSTNYAKFYASDGTHQVLTTGSNSTATAKTNYAYWSTDNFKTITSTSIGSCCYAKPFYVNGRWIFFVFGVNGSVNYLTKVSVCEQPFTAPSDSNTSIGSATINDVMHVEYVDGKYYAFVKADSSRCAVLQSNSPNFSGATISYVTAAVGGGNYVAVNFVRDEDKYVFIRFWGDASLEVSWSRSPASGYQTRTPTLNKNGLSVISLATIGYSLTPPLYKDGKVFWPSVTSPASKEVLICLHGIESGNAECIGLVSSSSTSSAATRVFDVNGKLAFFCSKTSSTPVSICVSGEDPLDGSTWKRINLTGAAYSIVYQSLQFQSGTVLGAFSIDGKLISIPTSAVPKIDIGNCYTYIKAK
ncbi:MAG: hypothetical protein HDR88_06070 [Bacteroides sp.]|nr:hypothetical protein [Bacteroides sp.]MBD5356556.1 hypothetical protein [Bacteroides sp.]